MHFKPKPEGFNAFKDAHSMMLKNWAGGGGGCN